MIIVAVALGVELEDQDYLLPLKVNPETETVHKNSKDKLKKDV